MTIFATIGDRNRAGALLSGHTDVVPADGQPWTRAPFALTKEGDRLYGRGTADMKGFIACVLAMVPTFSCAPLSRPIHLAFSYDEEVGCLATNDICDYIRRTMTLPEAAIVGEPTGMRVMNRHKGNRGLTSDVTGIACHSARPELGSNAIYAAAAIVQVIKRIAAEKAASPQSALSSFACPYTTLSVGVISGGTARNLVPGHCSLQWDVRAASHLEADEAHSSVLSAIDNEIVPTFRALNPEFAIATELAYDVIPLEAEVNSPAEALVLKMTGQAEAFSASFGTEAGFFARAGVSTVVCGPGRDSECHIADEWIEINQLVQCIELLNALTQHCQAN